MLLSTKYSAPSSSGWSWGGFEEDGDEGETAGDDADDAEAVSERFPWIHSCIALLSIFQT